LPPGYAIPGSGKGVEHPNRLREFRERTGLSQEELGRRAGNFSQSKVAHIEGGERKLSAKDAHLFAEAISRTGIPCSMGDLRPGSTTRSVPIETVVAHFESPARPDNFDLPEPREMMQAPRSLDAPEDCFVAEIADDSADRLYPAGSSVIVRRFEPGLSLLPVGAEILARRYATTRAQGETMEILVGILDHAVTGDLVMHLATDNRRLTSPIMIQAAERSRLRLSEQAIRAFYRETEIDYRPRPEDPAEILGEIVYATVPRGRPRLPRRASA
jgi:transcriptional regulator with XRE-family HTH domain